MKKILITLLAVFAISASGYAQKYAFIDTEYLLENIPAYESAQDQLDMASKKWQEEVDGLLQQVENMYKKYQQEMVLLSNELKVQREEAIVKKEKEARELRQKYFGPEGELFKKRQSLIRPIQDEVFNAVKELADEKGYAVIFDKAQNPNIIYSNAKFDVSDDVLEKLGYLK